MWCTLLCVLPVLINITRETREGGVALLTVKTGLNGASKSTYEGEPSLIGSLGLLCCYMRFLICLGCSFLPSTKYFFPYHTLFQCLCPHRPASWTGSHAGSPVSQYVSLNKSGDTPENQKSVSRARICKRLRSPGRDFLIRFRQPMLPCGAVRQIGLLYRPANLEIDSWAP